MSVDVAVALLLDASRTVVLPNTLGLPGEAASTGSRTSGSVARGAHVGRSTRSGGPVTTVSAAGPAAPGPARGPEKYTIGLLGHAVRVARPLPVPEPATDAEIDRERAEETTRKAVDLHWLDEGFAYAKQIGAKGVVIDLQADPNFNKEQHLTNTHDWDALPDYVDALRPGQRRLDRFGIDPGP